MAAPSAFQFYAENLNQLKASDLTGLTIKAMLVQSGYTPDTDNNGHDELADVTNEVANGNGYTTGGVALAGMSVADFSTTGYKFSSNAIAWTASGAGIPAWRYIVFYASGSVWGKTSPLLGYITGDSAPADIPLTAAGNSIQVNCPTDGWFTITRT